MVSKKSGIFLAAVVSFLAFMAVVYVSCTRPVDTGHKCNTYACENGGVCFIDTTTKLPRCQCPIGYDLPNCVTPSVNKYLGTWSVMQVIAGSDSSQFVHDTTIFNASLSQSATLTTFFINNFSGNPYYSLIVCTLDSTNSNLFTIDTISDYHMLFDTYKLLSGDGSISSDQKTITATFYTKQLSPTSNWLYDTVNLYMTLVNH